MLSWREIGTIVRKDQNLQVAFMVFAVADQTDHIWGQASQFHTYFITVFGYLLSIHCYFLRNALSKSNGLIL